MARTAGRDRAHEWPNHVIRDSGHLKWRYVDSPRDYTLIGEGDAYAAVGHRLVRGRRIAYIADLVAPPQRARRLVRQAVKAADGIAMVALPAPEHRRAYVSLGFVALPWTLDFMGKELAGRLNMDPRAWRFTLGDTDFF